MRKFIAVLTVCGMLMAAGAQSVADDKVPKGFGVGVETSQELGVMPFYTLSSMFQLGLAVGLKLQSNANVFLLAPQARFMFNLGLASTLLFLDAQLRFAFQSNNYIALRTRIGLMSMVAATLGIYGGISFLDFQFDPQEVTCIGLLAPFLGVQWTPLEH